MVMITGDYLKTAAAIAKNVKILQPQDNDEEAACDCAKLRPGGNYLANHEMDVFTSLVRVLARPSLRTSSRSSSHSSARVPSQP